MRCPTCGTDSSQSMKFCPECGTSLLRGVAEWQGERRQVTVFFSDLVESTSLSERWDPEELHELYAEYQSVCSDVIRRYDGHIDHYLGDGIVATFGYPTAHEDDAVRAVRSGVEIVQELERIRVMGERLHLRVAMHTGIVVVGDVGGSGRGEQMVSGEVPNIAARLQAAAEPDSVVISEHTRRLVQGHFATEDLGAWKLRGLSRPIRVFRVLKDTLERSRFDALAASGLTPFTGRAQEAETVRSLWARAEAGEGQALLLCGEAGIGKSRLLGLAREAAAASSCEIFSAQCSPYHVGSELHPIAETLVRQIGLVPEQSPGQKRERMEHFLVERGQAPEEALPLLAWVLDVPTGEGIPDPEQSPALRRLHSLRLLSNLLLHGCGERPALIVIEDINWADQTTVELAEVLATRAAEAPVLVAFSARSTPSGLPDLARRCTVVQVAPMPSVEARSLVARVAQHPLPEAVVREITERTEGIPLFVEAVTRTVLESGVLREVDGRYELDGMLPAGLIPATVHDSLMARIDRLGAFKPVAQLASAIGREFGRELLRSVLDASEDELDAALQRMIELDLVSRSETASGTVYTFKHALLQDAAYESLLRKTRQEFHDRIATVLLSRFPETTDAAPELLARHFEGAGRIQEAIDAWMSAGLLAQQRTAERECVEYLRRAIALLQSLPEDDPERIRKEMTAQVALAPALMSTNGWAAREVEQACVRARSLCETTGNGEGLFTALWGLWTVHFVRGDLDRAADAAAPVLQMALATDNRILQVAAHHAEGFTRYFRGEFSAAREHGEKALELFDLQQERVLFRAFQIPSSAVCLAFLTQSLLLLGYPDQAQQRNRQLLALIQSLANPACTVMGHGVGMFYDYDVRDVTAISEKAEEGYRLSVENELPFWAATMQVDRGWARCMKDDSATGIPEIHAGLTAFAEIDAALATTGMMAMLTEALHHSGQAEAALESVNAAIGFAVTRNERYYEAELYRAKAEILIDRGSLEESEAALRTAIAIAQGQQARLLELRSLLVLVPLLRERGEGREALLLLRPLYEWFTEGFETPELVKARALLQDLTAHYE